MLTRDARSLSADAQASLRERAVAAVLAGMNQVEAAATFGVARGTINRWVGTYRRKGKRALASKRRGRPAEPLLKGLQAATIKRLVVGRCPDQLQFPFALWTRRAVADLIEQRFGLRLSLATVGKYLRGWGLSPQKPVKRAFERDPKAVAHWLQVEYPAIKKAARLADAEIFWGDEAGVRSDHHAGRTWGKRGKTPVVPTSGKRFGCNMISAITNRGSLVFRVFHGRFNAGVFIDFLRRLIRTADRKVFLIVDRHSAHRARRVTAWLQQHSDELELFFLPSYSPDLNPDEYLNNDVKTGGLGRLRPRDKDDLVAMLRAHLHRRRRQPDVIRRLFQAEPARYAA